MPVSYQHWDDEQTTSQMFGDVAAVCELVEVFLAQYQEILTVLDDPHADPKSTSDAVHTLRSLYGIFNAHDAYTRAVDMDRHIRAGWDMTAAERQMLAGGLRAVAGELEDFLSAHSA
jgi:hypothetical protein